MLLLKNCMNCMNCMKPLRFSVISIFVTVTLEIVERAEVSKAELNLFVDSAVSLVLLPGSSFVFNLIEG